MLFRWAPEAVKEGMHLSVPESLTALVSKYIDCVQAVTQEDVENFFSPLVGRAKVRDAINALQAGRELGFVHVGGRVMLQAAELRLPHKPRAKRTEPWTEENPPELRPGKPLVEHRPRRRTARQARPAPPRHDRGKE